MSTKNKIYVLNKRVELRQIEEGFRASLDAVMLAAACPVKDGQSILDLGCGVGTAGLCVLERVKEARLTGVELQDDHAALAIENAALNTMNERSRFICADIRDWREDNSFDHVICNPPYLEAGTHLRSPSAKRATALGHADEETTLQDWITCAFHVLKQGGSLTMIHRADMIDKIIQALDKRFGAVEVIPLWPRTGVAAKRVIIRCIKGRKTGATLHPGLVLHEENGDYTAEAENILRKCERLF